MPPDVPRSQALLLEDISSILRVSAGPAQMPPDTQFINRKHGREAI